MSGNVKLFVFRLDIELWEYDIIGLELILSDKYHERFVSAVIRECFPTSILLGSVESPVEPTPFCAPKPVESDTIKVGTWVSSI